MSHQKYVDHLRDRVESARADLARWSEDSHNGPVMARRLSNAERRLRLYESGERTWKGESAPVRVIDVGDASLMARTAELHASYAPTYPGSRLTWGVVASAIFYVSVLSVLWYLGQDDAMAMSTVSLVKLAPYVPRSKPSPCATFPRTSEGETDAWGYVAARALEGVGVSLSWEPDRIDAYEPR